MMPTRRRTRRPAFTLTEILIALALTTLLLVGISQIFALTSTTISSGQALAKAMRSQKAIQTQLSADFNGVGPLGDPSFQSGMMPLVNTADSDYAAPYLSISCMRVATYRNQAEFVADTIQPADAVAVDAAVLKARSAAIRGTDTNKDGTEDPRSIFATGGETIPIYSYGERNFRTDTIGTFVRGKFQSQTGTTSVVDAASSNEAWVWYGHVRTFNSEIAYVEQSRGYGAPGDWVTPPATNPRPNVNNRFAEQFRLGRYAGLLIEPVDTKFINSSLVGTTKADRNGVVADSDYTRPIAFVKRNWWVPADRASGSMNPIDFNSVIYKFVPTSSTAGANEQVSSNGLIMGATGASTVAAVASTSLTDVLGAGIKSLRQRAVYVNTNYNTATGWRSVIPNSSNDRPWINPFPAFNTTNVNLPTGLSPASLSQRQQIIADTCSQFIVEFAGDFIGQNNNGTVSGLQPDGVLDFAAIPIVGGGFTRQTRWYGLPRDVDGNGQLKPADYANTPDVYPVRDLRGMVSIFESRVPPPATAGDYMLNVDEPATATNANGSAYDCAWGPLDAVKVNGFYALPQLIRVLVDQRDPNGTLKEAVTQEYVFPVRVTAAIKQETTAP